MTTPHECLRARQRRALELGESQAAARSIAACVSSGRRETSRDLLGLGIQWQSATATAYVGGSCWVSTRCILGFPKNGALVLQSIYKRSEHSHILLDLEKSSHPSSPFSRGTAQILRRGPRCPTHTAVTPKCPQIIFADLSWSSKRLGA